MNHVNQNLKFLSLYNSNKDCKDGYYTNTHENDNFSILNYKDIKCKNSILSRNKIGEFLCSFIPFEYANAILQTTYKLNSPNSVKRISYPKIESELIYEQALNKINNKDNLDTVLKLMDHYILMYTIKKDESLFIKLQNTLKSISTNYYLKEEFNKPFELILYLMDEIKDESMDIIFVKLIEYSIQLLPNIIYTNKFKLELLITILDKLILNITSTSDSIKNYIKLKTLLYKIIIKNKIEEKNSLIFNLDTFDDHFNHCYLTNILDLLIEINNEKPILIKINNLICKGKENIIYNYRGSDKEKYLLFYSQVTTNLENIDKLKISVRNGLINLFINI